MEYKFNHRPVLFEEVLAFFKNKTKLRLVDATAGGGGHLLGLAKLIDDESHIYAFDKDLRAHKIDAALGVKEQFPKKIDLIHAPFSRISKELEELGIKEIDGLICDLGVSSAQLDDALRGFSFLNDGPVDMRMDQTSSITGYSWLEHSSEKEIADALFNYAGEKKSRAIASAIKKNWPIKNSTVALANIVTKAMRQKFYSKIHPATRTFQAIRMAINDELSELEALLAQLSSILAANGVAVFISFHSVEDRMIKKALKNMAFSGNFTILTKKPQIPTSDELSINRRARSAKLRAIVKCT